MATGAKTTYKIKNWKQYNESLVQRGDITLWFDEEVISVWEHANDEVKVGRPFTYSDTAIECLLVLRELFRLPYRQTEGLGRALVKLMEVEVPIPAYTSLAKRAAPLNITLEVATEPRPIDIVVDSSGLKIVGAGEWRAAAYYTPKQKTWRKLHLTINAETQEIVAESLTPRSADDATEVPALLNQIEQPIKTMYADGAYDRWKLYGVLTQAQIVPVIPPRRTASIKQHGNCAADPLPRDEAIRSIRRVGRRRWKEEIGYHRRSLVETSMYRLKQSFGDRLKNKAYKNQQTEARLRCKILNHFTHLGMPESEWN